VLNFWISLIKKFFLVRALKDLMDVIVGFLMFAQAFGNTWTFAWESEGWARVVVCHGCQKGFECQRCGLSDNSVQK
jgi:hypothetical protein